MRPSLVGQYARSTQALTPSVPVPEIPYPAGVEEYIAHRAARYQVLAKNAHEAARRFVDTGELPLGRVPDHLFLPYQICLLTDLLNEVTPSTRSWSTLSRWPRSHLRFVAGRQNDELTSFSVAAGLLPECHTGALLSLA